MESGCAGSLATTGGLSFEVLGVDGQHQGTCAGDQSPGRACVVLPGCHGDHRGTTGTGSARGYPCNFLRWLFIWRSPTLVGFLIRVRYTGARDDVQP